MRLLTPLPVTNDWITSTNVPVDDAPAYAPGTYDQGDQVVQDFRLYECQVDGTTTAPVQGGTTPWLDIGAVNRLAAFDVKLNRATTRADEINYTIQANQVLGGVGFFRVNATEIYVRQVDPVDGVVFERTLNFIDNTKITDYKEWWFEPIEFKTRDIIADLSLYSDAALEISIRNPGGTAAVGEIALGPIRDLGTTLFGTNLGIVSYNRVERDPFGNVDIVRRGYSDRVSYDVAIDTPDVDRLQRLLSEALDTPHVFIGTELRPSTVVYGLYRDFNQVLGNAIESRLNIEVEGLA